VKHPAGDPGGAGPAPEVARALFPSDRLDLVDRYVDLLATDGVVRGLIGPREVPRLWDRHIVNCALLASALPRDASVADVGSGAGLPGLVVALARPDLRLTLIEPLLRRTTFLDEVVGALGLDHVVVRRDRADALHGGRVFDVVTARAVAPLDRLLGWCMPLVAPAGALIAMKGDSAEDEIMAAGPVLRHLGCAAPTVEVVTAPDGPPPQTRLVRVTWADPARVSLPTSGGRGGSGAGQRRSSQRKRRPS
jgi:16S rRNA (guanine527-N7)-methyltransferase